MSRIQSSLREPFGFTLIELMIAVVVMGLLLAVAIPNFVRFSDNAREAKVKSNCHTVQLAAESFSTMNSGVYAQGLATASSLGETMVDLLPAGLLMENAWSGVRTEPRDGAPTQPGEIGFTSIVNGGIVTGYDIDGHGKSAIIITVGNGS